LCCWRAASKKRVSRSAASISSSTNTADYIATTVVEDMKQLPYGRIVLISYSRRNVYVRLVEICAIAACCQKSGAGKSELYSVLKHMNRALVRWVQRKYKKFEIHKRRATDWLGKIARREQKLFAHWKMGFTQGMDDGSRMS